MSVVICGTCECHPCVCCVPSMPAPPMPWPSMLGTPIVVPLDHRRAFIREAVMRLACIREHGLTVFYPSHLAWERAKELWDAKPEDC